MFVRQVDRADQGLRAVVARSLAAEHRPITTDLEALFRVNPGSRRLLWSAVGGTGTPVGMASMRLFGDEGQQHLGVLAVHVDPVARRQGVGSMLLEAALGAARQEGRRTVVAEVVEGTSGVGFAEKRGWRRVLSVSYLTLSLSELAPVVAAPMVLHDARYRLERWQGAVSDRLAEAFASAKSAMADMPTGEMDYGAPTWDVERVKKMAQAVTDRGDTLLTVAALTTQDAVAGFTEVVVAADATRAQQYDTAVVAAHRGAGLGLRLKREMLGWLLEQWPAVREVVSDVADDNTHMLRVNEALGFRRVYRTFRYQVDLLPDGMPRSG